MDANLAQKSECSFNFIVGEDNHESWVPAVIIKSGAMLHFGAGNVSMIIIHV